MPCCTSPSRRRLDNAVRSPQAHKTQGIAARTTRIRSDYHTSNLVLTRVRGATGFADVTLDCAGTLSGWQPVGTSGRYEVTNVDLIRGGVSNGTCVNGTHTVSSRAPFGLIVWGLDETSAYAYPAGLRGTPSNSVVVPPTPK